MAILLGFSFVFFEFYESILCSFILCGMRGNSWHITVSIKRLYLFRNVKSDQTENAVTTVNVKAAYELESP